MGLRGSLRLPLMAVALLGVVLGFLLFSGDSGADPWETDNSGACPVAATACGEVCIYANCVRCPVGRSAGINCHPCVPGTDTGYTCVPACTGEEEPGEPCPERCRANPCPSPSRIEMDWSSEYRGEDDWDTPSIPPADDQEACERAGNPYHTVVSYRFDAPREPDSGFPGMCLEWDWNLRGGGRDSWEAVRYPDVSIDNPSGLEAALLIGGSDLPEYLCRDLQTGQVTAEELLPTLTPSSGWWGVGPVVEGDGHGGVEWRGGIGDSPTPPLPSGMAVLEGTEGGTLRLSGVSVTHRPVRAGEEPDWEIPVIRVDYSGEAGRPVYYRWWTYSGLEPTEIYLASPTLDHLPSRSSRGLRSLGYVLMAPGWPGALERGFWMPRRVLGMYSFQLAAAHPEIEGVWEMSNVVHSYVGYEWASRVPVPVGVVHTKRVEDAREQVPATWSASAPWGVFTPVPAPTLVPTLTPHPLWGIVPRPVSPDILSIKGELDDMGQPVSGSVVVRTGPYRGLLEYRYWTFNGRRPTESYVPWDSVRFGYGDMPEFVVRDLDPEQFYVFEVRAVGVPGHPDIRGKASPAMVARVR